MEMKLDAYLPPSGVVGTAGGQGRKETPARRITIWAAVRYLMDWHPEYRVRIHALGEVRMKLALQVQAFLGRKVSVETVTRCQRKYWRLYGGEE